MVFGRLSSRATAEPTFVLSQHKIPATRPTAEVAQATAPAPSKVPARRAGPHDDDPVAQAGAAEVRSIMQHGGTESPAGNAAWLGVSPPTRSTGAANPLIQDMAWRSDAYRCSHSNLQALREIDARGVSFLRCSSQAGDCRLLVDSPEYGLLSSTEAEAPSNSGEDTVTTAPPTTTVCYVPARSSCQAISGAAAGQPHLRVGTPLSCQMGFFVR